MTAHQAQKFQRVNQEMLSFQTVLGEVIDEFNNYFEGLQGKRRRDLNEFFINPYLIHYNRESNCRYSPT